eukprot:scaffold27887_cov64-Cyclotella_meneghiniana.AAC.16
MGGVKVGLPKFGDKVKNLRTYKTPGTPSLNMIHNTEESQAISREDQMKLYRSGVGISNEGDVPGYQVCLRYTRQRLEVNLHLVIVVRGISSATVIAIMPEIQIQGKVCLAQKSVTLSSSEAEWVALSEAVKEIMFALQLLESMKIKVDHFEFYTGDSTKKPAVPA